MTLQLKLLLVLLSSVAALSAAPSPVPVPNPTPKNWTAPAAKMQAQAIIDRLMAEHPEVASITMHGTPPDAAPGIYTMFAGSFPERIGNTSSVGDAITITKAVTQIQPKWGSPDWRHKVTIALPLKDSSGTFLPVALLIAFKTSPESNLMDTDYLAPGIRIRDGLQKEIPDAASLFLQMKP